MDDAQRIHQVAGFAKVDVLMRRPDGSSYMSMLDLVIPTQTGTCSICRADMKRTSTGYVCKNAHIPVIETLRPSVKTNANKSKKTFARQPTKSKDFDMSDIKARLEERLKDLI